MAGGLSAGVEFLIRGRDLHEVALPTYLLLYPLLGLGLGWLLYQSPHARHWVRPRGFFSVAPLPPEEAQARSRRILQFVRIGFGAGIATALVATALDFAWRGWPFLAGTLIVGPLLYPCLGMLVGYSIGLRPGDPKPSIGNFRFRMRTLMILVAYVALLLGLGSEAGRYSGVAWQYYAKALNSRTMVEVFQRQVQQNRVDLKRADNAQELRSGRIPHGLLPSQKAFLKGLEGKTTEQDTRYHYELIALGEDQQARLAGQNLTEYGTLIAYHKKLAEKYTKAAQEPEAKPHDKKQPKHEPETQRAKH